MRWHGPWKGDRPSRHQAGQHRVTTRRPREGARLRPRQAARAPCRQRRRRRRCGTRPGNHRRAHIAYMSPEQARGELSTHARRVRARRGAVRDALRPQAVRRRRPTIGLITAILRDRAAAAAHGARRMFPRSACSRSWTAALAKASGGAATPTPESLRAGARSRCRAELARPRRVALAAPAIVRARRDRAARGRGASARWSDCCRSTPGTHGRAAQHSRDRAADTEQRTTTATPSACARDVGARMRPMRSRGCAGPWVPVQPDDHAGRRRRSNCKDYGEPDAPLGVDRPDHRFASTRVPFGLLPRAA